MKTILRGCLLIACVAAGALARADDGDGQGCSKNHFILADPLGCWEETEPLKVARDAHTATLLRDGRVLVVGGGEGRESTSVEIYDVSSGKWTLAAPLHVARAGHRATLLDDGRVLVLGGHETYVPPPPWVPGTLPSFSGPGVIIDDTGEIYDPVADSWTVIPGPLTPRDYFSATLLADGKVLIVGGIDAWDVTLGSCELYDPVTGQWSATGSLFEPSDKRGIFIAYWTRWGHAATRLPDGRVLIAGGFQDDWLMTTVPQAQAYDPATGAWTLVGETSAGRGWHTASLLADGRVLVAGGDKHWCNVGCGEITLASTEIYDPATNAWSAGPDLHTARNSHTATLLRDGSLLVVGGVRATSGIPYFAIGLVTETETSPASAGPWASMASMTAARTGHTATLLDDGSVLVVGGKDDVANEAPALNTAVIYRPPRALAP